jgi:hypothetical protein
VLNFSHMGAVQVYFVLDTHVTVHLVPEPISSIENFPSSYWFIQKKTLSKLGNEEMVSDLYFLETIRLNAETG